MKRTRRYSEPAPTTYEELWETYFTQRDAGTDRSRAEGAVRKFLPRLDPAEREDVISAVFEKCMRARLIENYDPERAGFGSLFYCVARSICSNWIKHNLNKPLLGRRTADRPYNPTRPLLPHHYDMDKRVEPRSAPQERQFIARQQLTQLLDYAQECYDNPTCDRDLMLLEVLQLLATGKSQAEVARTVGVHRNKISKWLSVHLPEKFRGLNDFS